jgi:3-deoxy-D-manno-octulosonate 8-phosphate phosphatase (KDO 8-P phosphatase)
MDHKKIICDCDGVLTDGKIWISTNGEISKGFNSRDVRAIRELIANGYEFVILTASSWPGLKAFAKKTGAEIIVKRDKSEVDSSGCIVIVDDAWDIKLLKNASLAFAPKNCDLCVKVIGGIHILETNGGEGVISELARILIEDERELMLNDLRNQE